MTTIDDLFPDPDDPQAAETRAFANGDPFSLPGLYPPSVLGAASAFDSESLILSRKHLRSGLALPWFLALKSTISSSRSGPQCLWETKQIALDESPRSKLLKPEESTLFKYPEDFHQRCQTIFLEPLRETYSGSEGADGSDREGEKEEKEEPGSGKLSDHDEEDSLWLDLDATRPSKKPRYNTWDSFCIPTANEPANPYLSEAGSDAFDAALELHQNDIYSPEEAGTVVRRDVFIICLLHLGLGRSSVLFRYNRAKNMFIPVRQGLRVSGCSVGTMSSVIKFFSECGKNMKALQRFSERVYRESSPIPTRVALAECTSTLISALGTRLAIPVSSITSILHLESLFREPAFMLQTFYRIIVEAKGVKEDSKLLSKLFEIIQRLQFTGGSGWLRPILTELLRRVSRPWLEFVEEWIGLRGSLGNTFAGEWEEKKGFFVKIQTDTMVDDRGVETTEVRYLFDRSKIPVFMTTEDAEMIFECGKSLRYLHKFHPRHPLSKTGLKGFKGVEMLVLDWKFSWEDLEGIHTQARIYGAKLREAIAEYNRTPEDGLVTVEPPSDDLLVPMELDKLTGNEVSTPGKAEVEIATMLSLSAAAMSAPLPTLDDSTINPLRHAVLHSSRTTNKTEVYEAKSPNDHLTTFAPPLGITPLLSFTPLITVQSHLINTSTLRMFFTQHHLHAHFTLLYRFLLFGDSVFTSRLAQALFSDEYFVTERQEGKYRAGGGSGIMGLRVGGKRDNWPPASSELRLALAGLLNEAYCDTSYRGPGSFTKGKTKYPHNSSEEPEICLPTKPKTSPGGLPPLGSSRDPNSLPGGLSFSIRDLNPAQYSAVMDPHGIAALDFLKVQYKPPKPLDEVITELDMDKYDRIFKLLLRLVRMRWVVDDMWRNARVEAREKVKVKLDKTGETGTEGESSVRSKFRIYARHFINSLCGYIFETAIGMNWSAFDERLELVESAATVEENTTTTATKDPIVVKDNAATTNNSTQPDSTIPPYSLSLLHLTHTRLLDRILFCLFLRRRQSPIQDLLEEIFSLILRFNRLLELQRAGDEGAEEEIKEGYQRFRRKVKVLLDVVRGLAEKRGYGDARVPQEGEGTGVEKPGEIGQSVSVGSGEGTVFMSLVVRLEMNDCWRR